MAPYGIQLGVRLPIQKPFRRNVRQFVDGHYKIDGRWQMVLHPRYAQDADKYIRAYLIIQKDFQSLLDYIEPADRNASAYSVRTHELLMRTCIEVEANFKAILAENGYAAASNKLTMADYKKTQLSHRLASYSVKVPYWRGVNAVRAPFRAWATQPPSQLLWYHAYNETKHDRHSKFENANFGNLVDALSGLIVLLSAQFLDMDFSPADIGLSIGPANNDGFESAIGSFFRVKYPADFPVSDRYDFKWESIASAPDPFQNFSY